MSRASNRRFSLNLAVQRLSLEAGAALGVIEDDKIQQNVAGIVPIAGAEQTLAAESVSSIGSTPSALAVVTPVSLHPVTLFEDAGRCNLDGITCSIPAATLILTSHHFVSYVAAKEGIWGDYHGASCAVCMASLEIGLVVVNWSSPGYLLRRALGVPLMVIISALLSWIFFDWRPGWVWTPIITTCALWLSALATHPLIPPPRRSCLPAAKTNFMLALAIHMTGVVFVHILVLSTRLLADSDNSIITLVVTSAVFPGLAFLVRRFSTSMVQRYMERVPGLSEDERMKMLSRLIVATSALILFVPVVLLYFNKSAKLAFLSALGQLVTENVSKMAVVWVVKLNMRRKEEAAEEAAADEENGEGLAALDLMKRKHKRALAMLALRFHHEMVAEKGCIICAAVVAYLNFQDLVEASETELAGIGVMFFCVEAVSDLVFVRSAVKWFDLPMLTAIPRDSLWTLEHLSTSIIIALAFNSLAACVAMASRVELK
jgi:hypothetical protein